MYLYEIYVVIYHSNERENGKSQKSVSIADQRTQNTSLHHSVSIFGFLTAKKSPRYTRPNTPTRARTIKNESLKSSAWFSLAWCCLLTSLFICFSFLVSWPILFLHKVLFSNNQNIDQDLPVLINGRLVDTILATSWNTISSHYYCLFWGV